MLEEAAITGLLPAFSGNRNQRKPSTQKRASRNREVQIFNDNFFFLSRTSVCITKFGSLQSIRCFQPCAQFRWNEQCCPVNFMQKPNKINNCRRNRMCRSVVNKPLDVLCQDDRAVFKASNSAEDIPCLLTVRIYKSFREGSAVIKLTLNKFPHESTVWLTKFVRAFYRVDRTFSGQNRLRKLSSQARDDDTNNDSRNPSGASVSGSGKLDPGAADSERQNEDSENIRPSVKSEPRPIDDSVCPSPQTNFRRHTFAANFLHPSAYLHVRRNKPTYSSTAEESVVEKSPKRSKSVGNSSNIPSNHNADSWADYPCIVRFCINMCIQGWIALLNLLMAVRAIIVRMGFICFACVAIVTVVRVKNDGRFWLLCITIIPLLLELILAIKTHLEQSTNGMAISKWFSMCNFAYLICACPPIWIIELHHMDQLNNSTMVREQQQQLILNRTNPVTTLPPWLPVLEQRLPKNESITIMGEDIENYIAGLQLQNPELMHRQRRVRRHTEVSTVS
ncbi:Transmembrane protein 26 [Clonorchis sinensis]|uniref:Transmembrane protein 26 n=1 Tax=Clonorchis sinensis TaxID=79923 RepID=A0A3R7CL83_CLOSI|nr:Transmembrane protein 26 [Clonorchis sinensis]